MPYTDAHMRRVAEGERKNRERNTWPAPEPTEGRVHLVSWAEGLRRTLCPVAKNYHEMKNKLGQNQVTTIHDDVTCLTCRHFVAKLNARQAETGGRVPIDWGEIQIYWDRHGEGDPLPLEVFHG